MTKGHGPKARTARVLWLVQHRELWEGWLLDRDYDSPQWDAKKRQVVEAMIKDGMLSPKTYWRDVRLRPMLKSANDIISESDREGQQ